MKKLFFLLAFGIFMFNSFGQTQNLLNSDAKSEYEKSDLELNNVYKKILVEYSSDTLFIKNLKESQRIWIKLRDAQIKVKYPDYPDNDYSVVQMCKYNYLTELTKYRTSELNLWLTGIEEGDVCAGSIKNK